MKTYNRVRIRSFIRVSLFAIIVMIGTGCQMIGTGSHPIEIINEQSFVDSMGNTWEVTSPYQKVISLYSAHTENLYTIGAGDQLLGASATSIYPPEAAFLPRYDYRADPEPLIAANPDLVVIRPFINRNYNNYVKALKKAGIHVVSLYPDNSEAFNEYIEALAILVGKTNEASKQLELLYTRVEDIAMITSGIDEANKLNVYFESSKAGYKTVTIDSNPAKAIELAGGINIATEVEPIEKGSTIAAFGIENLMLNSDNIDVFVSQRGAMNSGGSLISIPQREGFKAIKAVANNNILEINEKIISSPTFRYYKGVNEIARMLYPEVLDDVKDLINQEFMTRKSFAELSVKLTHTPIFVPSSSHYYEKIHLVHTYGLFEDVKWTDEAFDFIETAVTSSFIKSIDREGKEFFEPERLLNREDLAYFMYIYCEVKASDLNLEIKDIDQCSDPIIVRKIVDYGIMDLDSEGKFNPLEPISSEEVVRIFEGGN